MLASKTLSLFSRRLSLTGTSRGINGINGINEMRTNEMRGINGINETRGIHTDIPITHRHEPTGMMNDMISSGTHSSSERIHKFMNAIYINKPRQVSLFSFNYRQQAERSTVRGICIGTNSRAGPPQRNVVVVAGLPLQDASLIGVGLYVAAMAARLSPMMARDVSVIPLAYPREYERRWRGAELANVVPGMKNRSSAFSALSALSTGSGSDADSANWLAQENVTIDLQNNCKPLETYITRRNKYFINIDANLTAHGSSMQYKSNSLPHLSSRTKSSSPRDFFLHSSPVSLPLSSSLSPSSSPFRFAEARESLIAPILNAPAIVLELKGTQALDDDQVVARGEEVIRMLKELVMD